jgi:hypothetical protein
MKLYLNDIHFTFSVLVCAVVVLCGWCIARFFRKRRPKEKKKNKDEKVFSIQKRFNYLTFNG